MQKENVITILNNLADGYENACQPICKRIGIPHTAFTILMFLANNPEYYTAKDICKFRAIKPSIASFNVDKLVKEGYIERQAIPGNRRSIKLVCTPKAQPVIEQGRAVISQFFSSLTDGMEEEEVVRFCGYLELISENVMKLKERKNKNV